NTRRAVSGDRCRCHRAGGGCHRCAPEALGHGTRPALSTRPQALVFPGHRRWRMNPQEFLALARSLAAGGTEAAWRSAVSRAYYAAFHVARELFGALRFTVPYGDQAHRYLTLRLSNS